MKKRKLIIIATVCLVMATVLFTACGESGFEKMANYISAHGVAGADSDYVSLNTKVNDTDFSAMYYAEDEDLTLGLRKTADGRTESLLLIIGKNAEICDVVYTEQEKQQSTLSYSALGEIMLADPECEKLIVASGADKGDIDNSRLEVVNGYIKSLLTGADAYLFIESGLRMSDLGFKY